MRWHSSDAAHEPDLALRGDEHAQGAFSYHSGGSPLRGSLYCLRLSAGMSSGFWNFGTRQSKTRAGPARSSMLRISLPQEIPGPLKIPPVLQRLRIESSLFIGLRQGAIPIVRVGLLRGHENVVGLAVFMPESQQLSFLVLFLVLAHGVPRTRGSLPRRGRSVMITRS